jgi:hypothetical protein
LPGTSEFRFYITVEQGDRQITLGKVSDLFVGPKTKNTKTLPLRNHSVGPPNLNTIMQRQHTRVA